MCGGGCGWVGGRLKTCEGKMERSPLLQSIICNLIMHAKICEVKIHTLNTRKSGKQAHSSIINPIALRMAKTPQKSGRSECNRVNY